MVENTNSMAMTREAPGLWVRAALWLALVEVAALAHSVSAQGVPDAPKPHVGTFSDSHDDSHIQPQRLAGYFPSKPSIAPEWAIPVENLGFAPPGALYLGERNSMVSLGFLDAGPGCFSRFAYRR